MITLAKSASSCTRAPALELRRAEILEPEVRALHAIERAMGAVGKRHHRCLGSSHLEVADELASKGARRGREPQDTDVIGKADNTYGRVRRADHAMLSVRCADDRGDVRGAGSLWSLRAGNAGNAAGSE